MVKFWALSKVLSNEFNRFSGITFCCRLMPENWGGLFAICPCCELIKLGWKLIAFTWGFTPEICELIAAAGKLSWEICPERGGGFIRGSIGGAGANVGKIPSGVVKGFGTNGKL